MGRVFKLKRPSAFIKKTSIVADSPHSGRKYPKDFNHACSRGVLRQAEDAYLDRVFNFLPQIGISFLQAEFPRSYIDVNRADRVTAQYKKFTREGGTYVPQEAGLVRGIVTSRHRIPIYTRPLPLKEVFNRIAHYYAPYHRKLGKVLDRTKKRHGKVVHLDLHSMPSRVHQGTVINRYDIILGTKGGTASPDLVQGLQGLFEACGYTVGINVPGFAGREIIRRTGHPEESRHSIQIEINRALYLDEETLSLKKKEIRVLQKNLRGILKDFTVLCEALPKAQERKPAIFRQEPLQP